MNLDQDLCFRAVESRDRRFEGRFVLAVRSTGIYCRPGCPAPIPKRKNCRFYPCAAAAEAEGFRPCRRCRPETAPGTPAWAGTSATVARALRLIQGGLLDEQSIESLADRLGLGERQLRRLFMTHLGASPIAIARTRRVHFARRLIDQTELSMTEVALSSGFGSVRSFNDAVLASFGRSPSQLRAERRGARVSGGSTIRLKLTYRAPFDWTRLLAFLEARAVPGVERIANGCYRRTVRFGTDVGWFEVAPELSRHLLEVAERATRLFDLEADPLVIAQALEADPRLRASLKARPGLRVPGAWDPFETAVRILLGQQISVAGATTLHGRLVARLGEPLPESMRAALDGTGLAFLSPSAETLASADFAGLGLTTARAAALRSFAVAVSEGTLVLEPGRGLDAAIETLSAMPGIGPWTAQMIAMRVMGEPDACPSGDLWLKLALAAEGTRGSEREVERHSRQWSPWRAYAVTHLLTERAESAPVKGEAR